MAFEDYMESDVSLLLTVQLWSVFAELAFGATERALNTAAAIKPSVVW